MHSDSKKAIPVVDDILHFFVVLIIFVSGFTYDNTKTLYFPFFLLYGFISSFWLVHKGALILSRKFINHDLVLCICA